MEHVIWAMEIMEIVDCNNCNLQKMSARDYYGYKFSLHSEN